LIAVFGIKPGEKSIKTLLMRGGAQFDCFFEIVILINIILTIPGDGAAGWPAAQAFDLARIV
jgi:hypothetical protein